MDRGDKQTDLHTNNTRGSVPVYGNLQRTWTSKSYNYKQNNRGHQRDRHHFNLPAIGKKLCLILALSATATPAYAETVGGVSATAAPVANSSGSVTNQAIQVLQGPYITNTYGNGIQCQGPTLNITPYITGAISAQKPYEDYYDTPVYDMRDLTGDFDDDGNPKGDGAPDNPGDVLWFQPTRTGQKDNYNLSIGVSATWSRPQDKKLQQLCKEAAAANIAMMNQLSANKRLDFEIARLKNCGNLLKEGISFHPKSPYYKICADVVVQNVTVVKQHTHSIPSTNASDLGPPISIGNP
jgi:hypothetical protein